MCGGVKVHGCKRLNCLYTSEVRDLKQKRVKERGADALDLQARNASAIMFPPAHAPPTIRMSHPADTSLPDAASRKRTVRSFVLRMGRMTAGQERAYRELWPRYGIDFAPTALDLDACFGRRAPRMLEIGFGTGEALLAYAQAHPEHDCLGIEVHRPGVGHLLLRAQQAGIGNVRILCHDAVEVLREQLPAESLNAVHVFFPDPWPKKRHHKRRLIQPAMVELLARALRPGGMLRLATDWEDYALQMQAVIAAQPAFAPAGDSGGEVPRPAERPLTRFERRGHRLGHGIWDFAYWRK